MQLNMRTVKIAGIAVAAFVVILMVLPLLINIKLSPKDRVGIDDSLGKGSSSWRFKPVHSEGQGWRR